ncbi:unnamed protein product [Lactuca saligna]|uniref:Uncharacterized protein n=1 Tax=Lactuca saligna TaxID=75948 RepID=A0AA35YLW7_LACSI|nr:unnamed protein product [Lactuca saligna]
MLQAKIYNLETIYPMAFIAIIKSYFSTRNGTPRQPLIANLARALFTFDTSCVPPSSLEVMETSIYVKVESKGKSTKIERHNFDGIIGLKIKLKDMRGCVD